MMTVRPSEVVRVIDANFGDFATDRTQSASSLKIGYHNLPEVIGLSRLLNAIPARLLVFDASLRIGWIVSTAAIEQALLAATPENLSVRSIPVGPVRLGGVMTNVIRILRAALVQCPDELPRAGVASLMFIRDQHERADLRLDMDRVREAFVREDWKSATVLAGAVVEALLLWAIEEEGTAKWTPIATTQRIAGSPELWDLAKFTDVAFALGIIGTETKKQIDLARNFRNLIHPGRQQRLGMECDRATALSAEAALEHVVRDLTSKYPTHT